MMGKTRPDEMRNNEMHKACTKEDQDRQEHKLPEFGD